MALSPELKALVSGAKTLHLVADEPEEHSPSIREQLAWIGFQKATKRELREIIMKAIERDPDA